MDFDFAAHFFIENNVFQIQLRFCQPALEAAARNADDAYLRHVALDEGVGGLCGRVRDEYNVFGGDVVFTQAVFKTLHNACRHALLMVVGGFHFVFADNFMGGVVDGNGFGVRAADVNAHTNFSAFSHGSSS